ncbi:MAG: hypothetical protein JO180_11875, partial [Gemmatirosa sp.]|nr:hypothetical protein [Gemmatirosa sp.]
GVHGAADVSAAEVASAIGEALGRPVRYVQVPYEGLRGALVAGGASPAVAAGYAALFRALDEQDVSAEPRTAATTTPTTAADWVRTVFAPAVGE